MVPKYSDPIRIGHIDLSFHDVSAREVEALLVDFGHGIERSAAPHEDCFRRLAAGEIDILVSAWLPASHSMYLDPIADQMRKVTVLYEPYCIWGVPDHVPPEAVATVGDLLKPEVLAHMDRRIQGINPGAGISRFSAAMIDDYGLGRTGYFFRPGTEAECFDRFEEAVASGSWIVIPLWHPQYLHARYTIRELEEPKGMLGGRDAATVIVRRDAEERIGQEAMTALGDLHLGNAKVSALDDALHRQG